MIVIEEQGRDGDIIIELSMSCNAVKNQMYGGFNFQKESFIQMVQNSLTLLTKHANLCRHIHTESLNIKEYIFIIQYNREGSTAFDTIEYT